MSYLLRADEIDTSRILQALLNDRKTFISDTKRNRGWIYAVLGILIVYLALLTTITTYYGTFVGDKGPANKDWFESLYFTVINVTTVGFGDIHPTDFWGRVISIANSLAGAVFFGFFVALLSAGLTRSASEETHPSAIGAEKALRNARFALQDVVLSAALSLREGDGAASQDVIKAIWNLNSLIDQLDKAIVPEKDSDDHLQRKTLVKTIDEANRCCTDVQSAILHLIATQENKREHNNALAEGDSASPTKIKKL